ncbi:hypothetical protein H0W80_03890 [Candidatus Saccharibacteria bacterium]|nr:hypothetical protein [Candidatus Saccharibacteria bacterium]
MINEPSPGSHLDRKERQAMYIPTEITDIVTGAELTDKEIQDSVEMYQAYHDQADSPQRIGLYGEDLEKALRAQDSVLMEYEGKLGEKLFAPVLVPVKNLHWYNEDLLKKQFKGKDVWCYVHPPINEQNQQAVINALKEVVRAGDVVITDELSENTMTSLLFEKIALEAQIHVELMGYLDKTSRLDVYTGPVDFVGVKRVGAAPSVVETYKQMLQGGELTEEPQEGPALYDVITGADAERLWQIYESPFDKLSESNPIKQGFSKEEFLEILQDPAVFKLVNRVENKISTLMIIVEDFDKCPWFKAKYYKHNFSEYFNTKNILIFPGIVSDESMRGGAYSLNLMDLGMKVYQARGSNVLLTFECAEVSTEYIPGLVDFAINNSGLASVSGLEQPVSTVEFKALSLA